MLNWIFNLKVLKMFLFNAILFNSYIFTYSENDLIFKLDERECLTNAKDQSYCEHAITSSDKCDWQLWN